MASFSNKVRERLVAGIKRFQPILSSAKARDVNDEQKLVCMSFCSGPMQDYWSVGHNI